MTRRAWGTGALALVVLVVLLIIALPGLSGVRAGAARALDTAGAALTIPSPGPTPRPPPVESPEQLASRVGSVVTAARLADAEAALAAGRAEDALVAYTAAVTAIVPVLGEDDRTDLSARAQRVRARLLTSFGEAPSPPQEGRTS